MFQTKEQDKALEELNEMELTHLPNKKFKIMILIKMFKKLGRMDEHSEKLEVSNKDLEIIKKNQTELKKYNN